MVFTLGLRHSNSSPFLGMHLSVKFESGVDESRSILIVDVRGSRGEQLSIRSLHFCVK